MTVTITPADQADAQVIAAALEKILPWPGYALKATGWPEPAVFLVPEEAAAQLLTELYGQVQVAEPAAVVAPRVAHQPPGLEVSASVRVDSVPAEPKPIVPVVPELKKGGAVAAVSKKAQPVKPKK